MPAIVGKWQNSHLIPIGCVLLFLVGEVHFWKSGYFFFHDTLLVFEVFHSTYQHVLGHGWVPEWDPYFPYGAATQLRQGLCLSPISYLTMLAGKTFAVNNSLLLFKASVLVEVFVFIQGLLLLSRRLFRHVATHLVVCLIGATTLLTVYNFPLNLRLCYLLPLILLYLLRFSATAKLGYLACALVLGVLSGFGLAQYYYPFLLYAYATMCGVLLLFRSPQAPRLATATQRWLMLLPIPLVAGTLYLLATCDSNLTFLSTFRDPETLGVSLRTFLRYGGGGFPVVWELFCGIPTGNIDTTFYLTAAGALFLIFSCTIPKCRTHKAMLVLFCLILLFSWGRHTPVARMVYYLPLMEYFRHVGLTYALTKTFSLVLVGYGVDFCFSQLQDRVGRSVRSAWQRNVLGSTIVCVVTGCVVVLAFANDDIVRRHFYAPDFLDTGWLTLFFMMLASFLIVGVVLWRVFLSANATTVLLACIIVVEGLVYHSIYFSEVFDKKVEYAQHYATVGELSFELNRTTDPLDDAEKGKAWLELAHRSAIYTEINSFFEIDSCVPVTRMDYVTTGVAALVHEAFEGEYGVADLRFAYAKIPRHPFFALVGCNGPKLHQIESFTEEVLPAGAEPVLSEDVLASAVFLESPETGVGRFVRPMDSAWLSGKLTRERVLVHEFTNDSLRFETFVASEQGAWIVYADSYDPLWTATVDHKAAEVWIADKGFKAVYLPPGQHLVEWIYKKPYYYQIVLWSLMVLGGLFIGMATICSPTWPLEQRTT